MNKVNISNITLEHIIDVLNNSGLVILPFDTCYGVCCNPLDQKAVDKMLQYKIRPAGKPISITVKDRSMAERYVQLNETAHNFYDRFLPGPYTIISDSLHVVAKGIESENGTLGIRIPDNTFINELVAVYDNPITSSSANQANKKTPYSVDDIVNNASRKSLELIDLIVDAGELPHNPPSTVIDTSNGAIHVLRKGEFLPEGAVVNQFVSVSEENTIQFGAELMDKFIYNLEERPVLFALQGDLGAGKTHFTKGVAQALGLHRPIQSPTFILSREYDLESGKRLYHIDTWRLEKEEDLESIGLDMMLTDKNVVVIEWADKVLSYLKSLNQNIKIIWVDIEYDKENETRRILKWSE